jgi:hypothetical protein
VLADVAVRNVWWWPERTLMGTERYFSFSPGADITELIEIK